VRLIPIILLLAPAALAAQADSGASRRIIPLPAVFYSPETKLGGGAAVTVVQRRAVAAGDERSSNTDRPTVANLVALYTQEAQLSTSVSGDWWSRGNQWNASGSVGFRRFPFVYYGTGIAVPDSGEEYTPRTLALAAAAHRQVRRGLYAGLGAGWDHVTMLERDPDGALVDGAIAGSRGGTVSSASALVTWDTRDNLYYAERGAFVRLQGLGAARVLGGDFAFRRVSLDARRYVGLQASRPARQARTLALQGVVTTTGGDVPFDRLAQFGGASVIRGYYEGRYRDRAAAAVQAELRQPLLKRVGVAAFYGAGSVAPRLGALKLGEARGAGGVGLRLALDTKEKINIRIDQGIGQGGSSGTYFTLGEAF
jgi:outer membrane protein assembly factor BamA